MRIGLTGGGSSVDKMVQQAQQAESEGFTSLWYASSVAGDPLVAMSIAGVPPPPSNWVRSTTDLSMLPLLQANRGAAAANAMGQPGFTLGLGLCVVAAAHGRPAPRIFAGLPVVVPRRCQ